MLAKTNKTAGPTGLMRARKKQEDRLLKRLSMRDRRQQEQLRRQILSDPQFKTI